LDSIRSCRGEFVPHPCDDSLSTGFSSLFIVDNSRWLRERYGYEARHYRGCYEFGGDVDGMLTDYDHYLFSFHDEFIEWIAAGIWFEKHPEPFSYDSFPVSHPRERLPVSAITERYVVDGLTCQARTNPKPLEILLQDGSYCSQPLFEFVWELDSHNSVDARVEVREHRGVVRSRVRNSLGTV
jgi:hypothetical protein